MGSVGSPGAVEVPRGGELASRISEHRCPAGDRDSLGSYPLRATRSELPASAAVRRMASRPFVPRHVSVHVGVVSSSDAWLAAPGEEHEVGHHHDTGVVEMLADRGIQ